jgi:hypothetical protein
MIRLTACLAVSLAVAACGAVENAMAPIDDTADHPVPEGLLRPDLWVYLTPRAGRFGSDATRWVRPAETDEERAREISDAAAAGKPTPRPRYRGEWTEQFEYRTVDRPNVPPAEYAQIFAERMQRNCPDAVITPIRVSEAEVLVEVVTSGCEPFGNEDELLRVVFDQPEVVELGYTVKATAMAPAQRRSGMTALYAWKFEP